MGKKVILVVGARPNFIKLNPLWKRMRNIRAPMKIIHTGQHYDHELSKSFFDDFDLAEPDIDLGVGSASHGRQTGLIAIRIEKVLEKEKPELVIVFGDVNSTIATALVTSKMGIPLAHVEAGLRSFDRSMPEEINRVLTDQIAEYLFTPSKDADANLIREGISRKRVFFVGNIMIDSLVKYLTKAKSRKLYKNFDLKEKKYWLLTLHRPSNVDNKGRFTELLSAIDHIRGQRKIIFSIHPRTKKMIKSFALEKQFPWLSGGENFIPTSPVGYIDFLSLEFYAEAVMTDSGGMQEETTFLGVPCLTVRKNTERPVTIGIGTNILCKSRGQVVKNAEKILHGKGKVGHIPPLWDGRTAKRITDALFSI
jgi:UDP-N-acetylglucosamine 2-epimerase (non-hydrolysing)